MMWLVCMLVSLACGILNPHIGLFSIFTVVQCLIVFCFVTVGSSRFRVAKVCDANGDYAGGQRLRKSGSVILTATAIAAAVLCVLSSIVGVIVWMLSSGQFDGIVSSVPFDIIGIKDNASACAVLTVLMVLFNALSAVLVFLRQLRIRRNGKNPLPADQVGAAAITGLKPGILTILGILAAMALGFLNPYFTWLTFIHAVYLLVLLIMALVLGSYRRMARQRGKVGYMARYLLLQMTAGHSYNRLMQMAVWVIALLLAAIAALTSNQEVMFWGGAPLDLGKWSWIPMAAAELITAVSFSVDIGNIRVAEERMS